MRYHTCFIIPKYLICTVPCGLGLSLIHSKGIWGWFWHVIPHFEALEKFFLNESGLLFLVHHRCQLTSDLRLVLPSDIVSARQDGIGVRFSFSAWYTVSPSDVITVLEKNSLTEYPKFWALKVHYIVLSNFFIVFFKNTIFSEAKSRIKLKYLAVFS